MLPPKFVEVGLGGGGRWAIRQCLRAHREGRGHP